MYKLKEKYKINEFEKQIKDIGDKIYSWQKNNKNNKIINLKKFKLLADLKADILIKKCIKFFFIKPLILSEENKVNKFSKHFWLIDPIDGTRSFYNKFKGYVIQLACIDKGKPIYSIIYAPALNRIWTAHLDTGAYLNGKRINKIKRKKSLIKIIDNYPEPKGIANLLYSRILNSKYIESGSIGLKAVLVADGTADIFVKDVIYKDWDIAPALLINKESGTKVCDLNGRDIKIGKGFKKTKGLVVCRKELLPKIMSILKHEKKK